MKDATAPTVDRMMILLGRQPGIRNAFALVLGLGALAMLFAGGVFAKAATGDRLAYAAATIVPLWFLISGLLDAYASAFVMDGTGRAGTAIVIGFAKSAASILLLLAGAVMLWLA